MRKRRLWITSQIMHECWVKSLNYYKQYSNQQSDEAWEMLVHNLKIVSLCREYIMR